MRKIEPSCSARRAQVLLLVRDEVQSLLQLAGAVRSQEALAKAAGDGWTRLAALDYMVELGEIRELTGPDVAGQHRVFVRRKIAT